MARPAGHRPEAGRSARLLQRDRGFQRCCPDDDGWRLSACHHARGERNYRVSAQGGGPVEASGLCRQVRPDQPDAHHEARSAVSSRQRRGKGRVVHRPRREGGCKLARYLPRWRTQSAPGRRSSTGIDGGRDRIVDACGKECSQAATNARRACGAQADSAANHSDPLRDVHLLLRLPHSILEHFTLGVRWIRQGSEPGVRSSSFFTQDPLDDLVENTQERDRGESRCLHGSNNGEANDHHRWV